MHALGNNRLLNKKTSLLIDAGIRTSYYGSDFNIVNDKRFPELAICGTDL